MKKTIDRFKKFIAAVKNPDRSKHLSWGNDDVEHLPDEDEDRRKHHLSWGNDDVEHLPDEEDIHEDMADPKNGVYAGVNKHQGGLANPGSGVPKYWKKGGMGASHGYEGNQKGDFGLPARPDHKEPEKYHNDHPDQTGFELKFNGKKKDPNIKAVPKVKDKHIVHPMEQLPHEDGISQRKRHEKTVEAFANHHANLTYGERNTISYYKANSYDINGALRQSKGRSAGSTMDKHRAKTMEKVTSHTTPHDMTVYRGIHDDAMLKHPVGHKYIDHAFTGTSLKHKKASGTFSESGHVFRIHVPAGTKGHYIDSEPNAHDHEHEFLLHRGTQFKYIKHSAQPDGRHVIDLHIVKQRGDDKK